MAEDEYMTREEAEKALKYFQEAPGFFCPVIKDQCRQDCVCFNNYRIVKYIDHDCRLVGGNCLNVSLWGDKS